MRIPKEPEPRCSNGRKVVDRVKRFTLSTTFRPLLQRGSGSLGMRTTLGMGSRPPHAYEGRKGISYKIIGNQWRCIKGTSLG